MSARIGVGRRPSAPAPARSDRLRSLAYLPVLVIPPYNIERTGDESYRSTMAVAGFRREELSVVSEGVTLTVSCEKSQNGSDQYLYRGIAGRSFKRTFQLAEYIKVEGAKLENGLLWIDLKWDVPEAMKPRTVPIATMGMTTKAVPFSAAA